MYIDALVISDYQLDTAYSHLGSKSDEEFTRWDCTMNIFAGDCLDYQLIY